MSLNSTLIIPTFPVVSPVTEVTTGRLGTKLISDDVIQYIYTINLSIICLAFCLFGITTNIINVIIFWRQGFSETVNIAFFGLTVSDFLSLITLLWTAICHNPYVMYADSYIVFDELQHKTGAWTHVIFTRITAFLTVYITLERCLCIAFPLKIKSILTPRRVIVIVIMLYIVIFSSMTANYFTFVFDWKFVPSRNKTMIGLIYNTTNRYVIQTFTYFLTAFYTVLTFLAVVLFSSILIWKLNQRSKFLQTATQTPEAQNANKDRQVIKMIATVAVIFIVSFTPSVFFFLAIATVPELNVGKLYSNTFIVLHSTTHICEAFNSSVNIFVYYNMSSKYRKRFRTMFNLDKGKLKGNELSSS